MAGNQDAKNKKKKNSASKGSKGSLETPTEEPKQDMTFEKARSAVKNTVNWMTLTQGKAPGLIGFINRASFEKSSDPPKTYAFQANRAKNRNPDFPLLDSTRVRLKIEKDTDNNYINASTVTCPPVEKKWIVAQHPMEPYFEDFWKMVFHEEIEFVVAIFSADDALPIYFPNETGKFVTHGEFWVHCRKTALATARNQANSYTIEVLPSGCSNARYTTILHYPHWPKGHVAPSAKVILKGIQGIQPADKAMKSTVLVHSGEGINRAMCFVMVDFMVELMFRNNTVNIPEMVTLLRNQRAGAFHNRVYITYALYVAIDYVKIRLTKFQNAPDILAEINALQALMKAEFASIIPKEPNPGRASGDVTVE